MPDLFAQGAEFDGQQVDLLLLAKDRAVEFVDQVFGVADLDFEFGDAGFQNVSFNAINLSSGVYTYQLNVDGVSVSKNMVLIK